MEQDTYKEIITNLAKNGHKLTPKLQDLITDYLSYQSKPHMKLEKITKADIARMRRGL